MKLDHQDQQCKVNSLCLSCSWILSEKNQIRIVTTFNILEINKVKRHFLKSNICHVTTVFFAYWEIHEIKKHISRKSLSHSNEIFITQEMDILTIFRMAFPIFKSTKSILKWKTFFNSTSSLFILAVLVIFMTTSITEGNPVKGIP